MLTIAAILGNLTCAADPHESRPHLVRLTVSLVYPFSSIGRVELVTLISPGSHHGSGIDSTRTSSRSWNRAAFIVRRGGKGNV